LHDSIVVARARVARGNDARDARGEFVARRSRAIVDARRRRSRARVDEWCVIGS
jgi:hypothetical protein